MKVAIISDSTLSHFAKILKEKALSDGSHMDVLETDFNVGQLEVFDDTSSLWRYDPDLVFYHVSSFNFSDKLSELVDISEQENFSENFFKDHAFALKKIVSKGKKVVITNLGYLPDRVHGSMSPLTRCEVNSQIDLFNSLLYSEIKDEPLINLLDLKYISCCIGIRSFHDIRFWAYGRFPFSLKYVKDVVDEFLNIAKLHLGSVKKVIVLDLDNTLWGGVIGDDGINGVEVGHEKLGYLYRNFQKFLRRLKDRGILLTISSKNDIKNVNLAFKEIAENALKLEDFTFIQANWENKAENIVKIATNLELSLDSFIFLDDNPAERELVKQSLPQVCVPNLGDDPSKFIEIVSALPVLQTISVTAEDLSRTELYKAKAERKKLENQSVNLEDFLTSLKMICSVENLNEANVERAYQLIQRSNQFNLTTSRFNIRDILDTNFSSNNKYLCRVYRLRDKFGDHGIISVAVIRQENFHFIIEEFVMSCRVLKRTVEQFIVNDLIDLCNKNNVDLLVGKYKESDKNSLVSRLFLDLGFSGLGNDKKLKLYQLDPKNFIRIKSFVSGEYDD